MPLQSLSTLADALDSRPSNSPTKEEKIHRNGDDSANVAAGPQLKRARVGPSRNSLPGTDASDSEVDDEKDDVREVRNGFECGIGLRGFDAFEEGDILECFTTEMVKAI